MNAEDVVRYLQDHPEVFEDYAEQLAQIYVPHPHGGRAIPIAERQILTLREKSRMLEGKLAELIQFGEDNDAIGEKMHRLALGLMGAVNIDGVLNALYYHLREDFTVPHTGLRVWYAGHGAGSGTEFAQVGEAVRAYAGGLEHPRCATALDAEIASWFGEAAGLLRSYASVPLRDVGNACIGLLVLASEDSARFYPEMGTLYLKRLGELASAALQRYW